MSVKEISFKLETCPDAMWVFKRQQSIWSRQPDFLEAYIPWNPLSCPRFCLSNSNNRQTKNIPPKQNNQKRLPATCKLLKPGAPLDVCHRQMIEFKKNLLKDKTKVRKVLKWPFRKDEIYAVIERLRNIQSILNMAITSDKA